MSIIDSFDIFEDFFADSQLRVLFKEEYEAKIPSQIMWGLLLYYHPKSKFFNESPANRLKLIQDDYIHSSDFDPSQYEATVQKIKKLLLTKAERSMLLWEQKLNERDTLMAAIPYTMENFEVMDKLVTNSTKLWDQYFKIMEALNKEEESRTEGDIEESISEKKLI